MSVFFTSDPHFLHLTVAQTRGWNSEELYTDYMLDDWEMSTKPGDQIWIYGDLTIGATKKEDLILARLKYQLSGRSLHFVPGNHDSCHPMANRNSHSRVKKFYETFDSVQLFTRRKIASENVLGSHFPYTGDHKEVDRGQEFRLQDRGSYLIHGHTHQSEKLSGIGGRQISVGWDTWNKLVDLEEIAEIINNE